MAEIVYMVKDGRTGKLSEVKSWTASTKAETKHSDMIIESITTESGPFEPGKIASVAHSMRFKNKGDAGAKVNIRVGVNDGTGWTELCNVTSPREVISGNCTWWLGRDAEKKDCLGFTKTNTNCDSLFPTGVIEYTMPDEYGVTLDFAIKVWGADEPDGEPDWPTLAMIKAGGEKRITRRRRPARRPVKAGLSGNQKVAITGVCGAVAGGLIGYAVGRG